MVAFTSLIALAFSTLVVAKPSPPPRFQVTNLALASPKYPTSFTIGFNVTDPIDSSKAYCEARWPGGSPEQYPKTYLSNCTNPVYAFKFDNYVSWRNFSLDVKHTTKKQGDKISRYAKGRIDGTNTGCTHFPSGYARCGQLDSAPILLSVYLIKED